jgi:hypothetical protein
MNMLAAVRANNVERVQLLRSRGKGWTENQWELWSTAVELGHLEMLKCLHTLQCKRHIDSYEIAIEHGHGRRLVEWLRGIGQRYIAARAPSSYSPPTYWQAGAASTADAPPLPSRKKAGSSSAI